MHFYTYLIEVTCLLLFSPPFRSFSQQTAYLELKKEKQLISKVIFIAITFTKFNFGTFFLSLLLFLFPSAKFINENLDFLNGIRQSFDKFDNFHQIYRLYICTWVLAHRAVLRIFILGLGEAFFRHF